MPEPYERLALVWRPGADRIDSSVLNRSAVSIQDVDVEVQTYLDADLYVPKSTAVLAKEPERLFTHPDIAEPNPRITGEAELMIGR